MSRVFLSLNRKKRSLPSFWAVVFFLSLGLFFFSAHTATSEPSCAFVDSGIGDARVLIPIYADDATSSGICNLVYSGLTKLDKDLNVVPDLARSWDISEDGKIITFQLKEDVKWHDGEDFSAYDVKFTYEAILDPANSCPYVSGYTDISDIEILGEHEIRFHYYQPFAPALSRFGMGIIPKHIFAKEENIRNSVYARNPIGTGPYRFVRWVDGQHIVLESFDDHYDGAPRIKRYVYRIIPDQAVQFMELVTGGIDSMGLTPYQYVYQSRSPGIDEKIQTYKYLSHSYTYIGYNLADPILSDVRVRRALSYAINRDEIIEAALLGLGEKCTGPFLRNTPFYNDEAEGYEYDPEKARSLLASAGWEDTSNDGVLTKNGRQLKIGIATNQGNIVREQVATIVQAQWKDIGVESDIKIVSWAAFLDEFIHRKNFQAVLLGWTVPPEPDPFAVWHSSSSGVGGLNFISYSNSSVDQLIEKARREFDEEKRANMYQRIHKKIAEDCPYTFLFFPYSMIAVERRFKGIEPAPAGIKHNFEDWYVPADLIRYDLPGSRR